jgi:hypothetical protein
MTFHMSTDPDPTHIEPSTYLYDTSESDDPGRDHTPIIVIMDGGIIQEVVTRDGTTGRPLLLIDYDTDGMDPVDLTPVPQDTEGKWSLAYVAGIGSDQAHPWIAEFAARWWDGEAVCLCGEPTVPGWEICGRAVCPAGPTIIVDEEDA